MEATLSENKPSPPGGSALGALSDTPASVGGRTRGPEVDEPYGHCGLSQQQPRTGRVLQAACVQSTAEHGFWMAVQDLRGDPSR